MIDSPEHLARGMAALERCEELLRPFRAAHERLQAAVADAADWRGRRAPEDTAEETLLALRRMHEYAPLPGYRQADAVAQALAEAVSHLQAVAQARDTSPGVEARRRAKYGS